MFTAFLLGPSLFARSRVVVRRPSRRVFGAECVGLPVPFIMGGNTFHILDDLLATGTSFLVCNVETNQPAFVERVARTHPQVKVRVNMSPGIVVCSSTARIQAEIDRILAFAGGRPNCLLGTGALPLEDAARKHPADLEYVS
jgi:hypothetical protein